MSTGAGVRCGVPTGRAWLERGYEGLVAKDEASPYTGGPTRSWLKVKVPGWTDREDKFKRRLFGG